MGGSPTRRRQFLQQPRACVAVDERMLTNRNQGGFGRPPRIRSAGRRTGMIALSQAHEYLEQLGLTEAAGVLGLASKPQRRPSSPTPNSWLISSV